LEGLRFVGKGPKSPAAGKQNSCGLYAKVSRAAGRERRKKVRKGSYDRGALFKSAAVSLEQRGPVVREQVKTGIKTSKEGEKRITGEEIRERVTAKEPNGE